MPLVSVTELNQQTAKVLERVKAGESIDISERGRPIARLVPILAHASPIERLVSEGRAIAATDVDALLAPLPPAPPTQPSLSKALERERSDERF